MKNIAIRGETIRLGQLLKVANLASTGGEAKILIQAGEVKVNGCVELRRGRQLRPGDTVEVGGEQVKLTRSPDDDVADSQMD